MINTFGIRKVQVIFTASAFVLSQLLFFIVLQFTDFTFWDISTWLRFDSGHYLAIASNGYEYFPCSGHFGFAETSKDLCGNTGWFPGYPLLIKLANYVGVPYDVGAVFLSKIFYFISIFLVAVLSKIEKYSLHNFLLVIISAFSFSFIYMNAGFPISTLVMLSLLGFYHLLHRNILIVSFLCFIASVVYPTGFLLAFILCFSFLVFEQKNISKQILLDLFYILLGGGLGVLLVFLFYQIDVGDWQAFIKVQSKYGHGFRNPIFNFFKKNTNVNFSKLEITNIIQLQSIYIGITYLISSLYFFRKKDKSEIFIISYVYMTFFFVFPWLVGGNLSVYRSEALLMPFVLILKDVKIYWLVLLLLSLLALGGVMSYLFFTSVLV